jgi:hypothetical protein
MRAEALWCKEGYIGAVAFSHTGDPATGDFSDVSSAAATSTCSIWRGQDHEGPLPHPAQDQTQ